MPADTPPADLHLDMQDVLHHALGMDWSFDADNDAIADAVSDFFAALSEWMGDSLVDRTWTRWDREELQGVEWCTTHDEPDIEGWDPFGECRKTDCPNCLGDGILETLNDAEPFVDCPLCGGSGLDGTCQPRPLYTLTPRED